MVMSRSRPFLRVALAVITVASTALSDGFGHAALAASPVAGWPAGRPATFTLQYNDPDGSTAEAPRRRLVALNAWQWPAIARIKAANRSALVVVYKDLSSTRDSRCSASQDDLPTGVDYCQADTAHPEWFLTDAAGRRMRYGGYPDHWQMDVGNTAYQQAWIDNVRSGLAARGWDGVLMDNALTGADDYHRGVTSPRYPTNESIQKAYQSFLAKIGGALTQFTMANISNGRRYPGLWKSYIGPLQGGYEEIFLDWSSQPNREYLADKGPDGWSAQVHEITDAEAMGKMAMVRAGSMEGTVDVEGFKYALGSYLLANGGHSFFSFGNSSSWHPAFDWNLGAAIGPYYAVGKSVYRRDFSAGVVLVNASERDSATIDLRGQYQDEDNRTVTSVTLGPQRAAILRRGPS